MNEKSIWTIADRINGSCKPIESREVIPSLTVIRRFDCVLEDTGEAVMKER